MIDKSANCGENTNSAGVVKLADSPRTIFGWLVI